MKNEPIFENQLKKTTNRKYSDGIHTKLDGSPDSWMWSVSNLFLSTCIIERGSSWTPLSVLKCWFTVGYIPDLIDITGDRRGYIVAMAEGIRYLVLLMI